MRPSPSNRVAVLCIALPALVSVLFLLVVSAFVYGHVSRPGLYAEVLLVLYVSALLLQFQPRKLRGAITNSLLLLALYGACLVKYLLLREGLSWSDFMNLGEFWFVLSAAQRVALAAAAVLLGGLLVTNLARPRLLPAALLLAPLLAYLVGTAVAPAAVYGFMEKLRPTSLIVALEPWRDGPLLAIARQPPRVGAMAAFLAAPPAAPAAVDPMRRSRALAGLPPPRRNVHIVVLESFVDPIHFRALDCPSDPIDPRFRRWIDESDSVALSATFAGRSARAEFELLCGVPSFERLGVDLMSLRGAALPCLPHLLRQAGYVTMSHSSGPASFFNHSVAHAALGFDHPRFGEEFVITEDDKDGEFLADDRYYPQVLERVLPAIRQGRPLLTYTLTWAGHYPFDLNPIRHPPVCATDTVAGKVANAAHYASAAVADYVERIESHDPEALIVVLSDHLPTMGVADAGYREADYRFAVDRPDVPPFWADRRRSWLESRATTLVVRMAQRPVSLGLIPQYLIPEAVLDLLTGGGYCRATECFRSLPIIDRPRGTEPVLTTPDVFPRALCESPADADRPRCRTGADLHRVLEVEYEALLRIGVREAPG